MNQTILVAMWVAAIGLGGCTEISYGYRCPCASGFVCCQDTCVPAQQEGKPATCPATDQCHEAGICDPSTRTCSTPPSVDGKPCDDTYACTVNDSCQAGACQGTPVTCPATDQCHEAGTCDSSTGTCSTPLSVDGKTCDDGDASSEDDTCHDGVCRAETRAFCPDLAKDRAVAYWSFDAGSNTTVNDDSGHGHVGTCMGTAVVDGISGKGMAFSGSVSGVDIPDGPAFCLTESFAIEVWVNATSIGNGRLFFRGDGRPGFDPYVLQVFPGQGLQFLIVSPSNQSTTITAPISTNAWHHVVGVHDAIAHRLDLYLDGALAATNDTTLEVLTSLDPTWSPGVGLGHHANRTSNDYGFEGTLDEISLWPCALGPKQVLSRYRALAPAKP